MNNRKRTNQYDNKLRDFWDLMLGYSYNLLNKKEKILLLTELKRRVEVLS